MTAIARIERELLDLGYPADGLFRDYKFADVLSAGDDTRTVSLAAFTQLPESFRSAAFGVVNEGIDPSGAIMERRALGAPVFFSIGDESVGVWSVGARSTPTLRERVPIAELPQLFRRYRDQWNPQALHRAKALEQQGGPVQFDFIDLGLLPAIESEVEAKLHQAMADVVEILSPPAPDDLEAQRSAFRLTFRLLAAKILADRGHAIADQWHGKAVSAVLAGIQNYYGLPEVEDAAPLPLERIALAWERLGRAINLRNISADSLAFVYENTLVTADTRRLFGTHSTPRALAEYVVSRLQLERFDLETFRLVEPFAGAGIFLVAALKRLRDLLPSSWTAAERHAFLVQRLEGAELDVFACEVATLSLILADYPNANGWKIASRDLFEAGALAASLTGATVVLCNPPFELFNADERNLYPDVPAASGSKASYALQQALDAKPEALGFVLPRGFLLQRQYRELRARIADAYEQVELVSLPDRIFEKATYPCALVIASRRRAPDQSDSVQLISRTVAERERVDFLSTGSIATGRSVVRALGPDLWISELSAIWIYLDRSPRLGDHADVFRGLRWKVQGDGVHASPGPLREQGYYRPRDSLMAFSLREPVWLDTNPAKQVWPAPLGRPWQKPKILINNQRTSRGPWRLAAASDRTGMLASQQFTALWPTGSFSLLGLEAVLNGPLANAFVTEHSTDHDFTNEMLKCLPLPARLDEIALQDAIERYTTRLAEADARIGMQSATPELNQLLVEIDAIVLSGYDLPPKLERQLLDFFAGARRPTLHSFSGWLPDNLKTFTPLSEWLRREQSPARGPWVLDVFKPIPPAEADALAHFID